MNPEQVLAALAEMYASCVTYRDRGKVTTTWFRKGEPNRTTAKPFETAFIRPDRFRFEFRDRFVEEDPWHRYLVWANGKDVRTWWELEPAAEVRESLSLALAGATGISGGAAHTIPNLMMPEEIGGRTLTDLVEVTSLPDADIGDVSCYRIQGRPRAIPDDDEFRRVREEFFRTTGVQLPPPVSQYEPITIWIDRGALLVRRIEDYHVGTASEQITDYEPESGTMIPEEELRFAPLV